QAKASKRKQVPKASRVSTSLAPALAAAATASQATHLALGRRLIELRPYSRPTGQACLAHITCRRVRSIDEGAGLARVYPALASLTLRSNTSPRTGCCARLGC